MNFTKKFHLVKSFRVLESAPRFCELVLLYSWKKVRLHHKFDTHLGPTQSLASPPPLEYFVSKGSRTRPERLGLRYEPLPVNCEISFSV